MTVYVALLRGVTLGKRNLKMEDLRAIAGELGLEGAKTYIASGNLIFGSSKTEQALKSALEVAISKHMDAKVEVMIRNADEIEAIVRANPFAKEAPNLTVAIFLDEPPAVDAAETAKNIRDERLALGKREIYVHYPSGQGRSKLRLAGKASGTARNMNTVAKLAELAREMA